MNRFAVLVSLLTLVPMIASAQVDTTDPAQVVLTQFGGGRLGYLTLGRSHPADAERLLSRTGGLGPKRGNTVTFHVGSTDLRPPVLYNPPRTINQLYFDNDTLVLFVEGAPHDLPTKRPDFVARYRGARETQREAGWYELQVQLKDCIWLIAVFTVPDDRLDSNGYAYTCPRR